MDWTEVWIRTALAAAVASFWLGVLWMLSRQRTVWRRRFVGPRAERLVGMAVGASATTSLTGIVSFDSPYATLLLAVLVAFTFACLALAFMVEARERRLEGDKSGITVEQLRTRA